MNKVLIIDDEQSYRVTIKYILEKSVKNCEVLSAKSGLEGIEIAKKENPDTILLDVVMPEMDGYEVCKILKSDVQTKSIPIILASAFQKDTNSRVLELESGADVFLSKPFDPTELSAQVTSMLRIRNTEKTLKKSNEELDAFAHTVAHDLRTPIGSIIGFADILNGSSGLLSNDERHNFLLNILDSGSKTLQILDSLLLLTNVRKADAPAESIMMEEIVDETVKRLSLQISKSNAKIFYPPSWPDSIGYAPWVEEILVNYISNAIKYGGNSPEISIGANIIKSNDKDMVRYWVRDNGPGISNDDQKLLFRQFERLNQAKIKGHGLGLSIVRRIAEKLGGCSGVKSELGKGCLFYFTLPCK